MCRGRSVVTPRTLSMEHSFLLTPWPRPRPFPDPRPSRLARALATLVTNRQAQHDYHILETVEARLALQGTEVKSIGAGNVNLRDAYARAEYGEIWMWNAHIAPLDQGNRWNHEPWTAALEMSPRTASRTRFPSCVPDPRTGGSRQSVPADSVDLSLT